MAVLDDDPTGSQSVHDVPVVFDLADAAIRAAFGDGHRTCFVLTNTRSLDEPSAVAVNLRVARTLFAVAEERRVPVQIVSRGDSTLRGHVLAEIDALRRARREALGRDFDGVLMVPAYLEAGRVTAGDVHWARVGDEYVPVGETEYAGDATFGYRSSNLRDFLAEVGRGRPRADQVASIGLDDIRAGGVPRVSEILAGLDDGAFAVVNALDYADLECVALAVAEVGDAHGKTFLCRSGPSFVRALDGQEPIPPLTPELVRPAESTTGGIVVVGSHVGRTSRQLAVLGERTAVRHFELDVGRLMSLDDAARTPYAESIGTAMAGHLSRSDVLLSTCRRRITGGSGRESLRIARTVSAAVSAAVRAALAARPGWVLAKGGITSHDVAVHGLGIRRATVAGQFFPGMVSLFRPVDADARITGTPYVVFAGNVGDDAALADVVARLRGGN